MTHTRRLLMTLSFLALSTGARAQVLPAAAPTDVHLVTVTREARLLGERLHWVYQGPPGQRFCVAFATSQQTALSSKAP